MDQFQLSGSELQNESGRIEETNWVWVDPRKPLPQSYRRQSP
jgi:hypothetical protein